MSEAIKLFQYNTLGALMAGLYGGTLTVGELLEHGDLGLGTLDSIDGELIVLDGKAYQAKGSEGKVEVVEVSPDEKVPYAAVVPHQAEVIFRQRYEMTDKELEDRIESYYDGVNLFRSIKIKGHFKHMHVRMIPKSNDRPCAGRRRSTGGAPAAALLLLGHCGHRHRRRAAAPDLRLLSAVRHHGRAGQQPARAGLQRAAHGGKPCGCVRAAAGVDRHYFPAEPHPFYAVHQLPHQLGTDRTGASGLPACGAAASAPEAAADGINPFCIKAAPDRLFWSVRRCFYYITGPHPVPSSAQTPARC